MNLIIIYSVVPWEQKFLLADCWFSNSPDKRNHWKYYLITIVN